MSFKATDETKTMKERMLCGVMYNSLDEELTKESLVSSLEFLPQVNSIMNDITKKPQEKREILDGLFRKYLGKYGKNAVIIPPFNADFDCAPIIIEERVIIGCNVGLYTAGHPLREIERRQIEGEEEGLEYALPITIKQGAWIGANVIILPGITIGEGSVIAPGSVVTRDIPKNCYALGNPAKIIKKIDQKEELSENEIVELEKISNNNNNNYIERLLSGYTAELQRKIKEKKKD